MASAGSSRAVDEDVDMVDAECVQDGEPHDERQDDVDDPEDLPDDGGGGDEDDEDDEAERDFASSLGSLGNEPSAMSIFGDYRQLGSYMIGISGRLKTMLNNIKPTADPTTRLVTLQELSELLSISTEDTLAGSFQVEAFIRELVKILGGTGNDEDEGDDDDAGEQDEDAALAAALAMSAGGAYQGDENLEAQVLACRCLANLMEALPGVAHTVVYHGAIPVLCSKLIEISYIDLAEQTLSVCASKHARFESNSLLTYNSDFGEDLRGVSQFNRTRGRFGCPAQLPRLLLHSCPANRIASRSKLLPQRLDRALPHDPHRLAYYSQLSRLL